MCILILNTLQNNLSRFIKFNSSYSNARNLGSAYKFAFGGDINRAYWINLTFLGQFSCKSISQNHFAVGKPGSLSMAHYLKTVPSMISSNYSRLTNCVDSRCQSFATQLVVHLTDLVKSRCNLVKSRCDLVKSRCEKHYWMRGATQ